MSVKQIQTEEECVIRAAEFGCEAFFATDYEVMVDLDYKNGRLAPLNIDVLAMFETNDYPVISRLETTSKSGHGRHVYLRLGKAVDHMQRALFQATLGSDPKREVFAVFGKQFSALYETPTEAERVKEWRKQL